MKTDRPGNRVQRRHGMRLGERARRSGDWGAWKFTAAPAGIPGAKPGGWPSQVREVRHNELYSVLIRPVSTEWGIVQHCCITTLKGFEPPWRDMQRIKNELFGEDRTAVEVMPPQPEVVDEANSYHIWVMPEGFRLPFTIAYGQDRRGRILER